MKNPNLLDYVNRAVLYIEEHIKDELSLEKIADDLFISKFYLNRIFTVITGRKLMSYVNGRKLMNSLHELLYTNMRILDIALEYGYHFEKSYARAFKREFGMTPSEFRETKSELKTTPAISVNSLTAISEQSIIMEPTMIVKPAFTVIGSRHSVNVADYISSGTRLITEVANDFYYYKRPAISGQTMDQSYYGHVLYDGEYCHYTACVEVEGSAEPPEGMVKLEIPTNHYWVFKYVSLCEAEKITYSDFAHIIDYAFNWLSNVEQAPIRNYHFEKISERFKNQPYCELDLFFPTKK